MKTQIIKDLVKVADSLDRKGLYKESDMVDALIQKMAGEFDYLKGRGDFSPSGRGDNDQLSEDEKEVIMEPVKSFFIEHLKDMPPSHIEKYQDALAKNNLKMLHELVKKEIITLEKAIGMMTDLTVKETLEGEIEWRNEILAAIEDADSRLHDISVLK